MTRIYADIAIVATLLGALWISLHIHNLTIKEFATYKEIIRDQVQKNEAATAITEAAQKLKHDTEQAKYSAGTISLAAALKRLRDIQGMSGFGCVSVAGDSPCTVPGEAGNTSGIPAGLTIGLGAYPHTEFYEKSMTGTAQCQALIEFLR